MLWRSKPERTQLQISVTKNQKRVKMIDSFHDQKLHVCAFNVYLYRNHHHNILKTNKVLKIRYPLSISYDACSNPYCLCSCEHPLNS